MNFDFGRISAFFNRLARRERIMLGLAIPGTLLILGYTFIWEPLQASAELLSRKIVTREKDLREVQNQHDHYLDVLREIESYGDLSEMDANFNLLGYLQGVVSQAVPREKITSLNPTTRPNPQAPEFVEEIIDIKLTQVNLAQIVDLMYRVEKGEHPLRFGRVNIKKRFNDQYNFDVHASVSILKGAPAAERPEHAPEPLPPRQQAPAGRPQGRGNSGGGGA